MNRGTTYVLFVSVAMAYGLATSDGVLGDGGFDPLKQVLASFPRTVKVKAKGRLVEFCPDNTCDGFVASDGISTIALKDFAYLYIFFFSDYYVLQDWRGQPESKTVAHQVLSKPEYRDCKSEQDREAARCVLRHLSSGDKIKLIFIRYDENMRNVVPKNLPSMLSEKGPLPKQ